MSITIHTITGAVITLCLYHGSVAAQVIKIKPILPSPSPDFLMSPASQIDQIEKIRRNFREEMKANHPTIPSSKMVDQLISTETFVSQYVAPIDPDGIDLTSLKVGGGELQPALHLLTLRLVATYDEYLPVKESIEALRSISKGANCLVLRLAAMEKRVANGGSIPIGYLFETLMKDPDARDFSLGLGLSPTGDPKEPFVALFINLDLVEPGPASCESSWERWWNDYCLITRLMRPDEGKLYGGKLHIVGEPCGLYYTEPYEDAKQRLQDEGTAVFAKMIKPAKSIGFHSKRLLEGFQQVEGVTLDRVREKAREVRDLLDKERLAAETSRQEIEQRRTQLRNKGYDELLLEQSKLDSEADTLAAEAARITGLKQELTEVIEKQDMHDVELDELHENLDTLRVDNAITFDDWNKRYGSVITTDPKVAFSDYRLQTFKKIRTAESKLTHLLKELNSLRKRFGELLISIRDDGYQLIEDRKDYEKRFELFTPKFEPLQHEFEEYQRDKEANDQAVSQIAADLRTIAKIVGPME